MILGLVVGQSDQLGGSFVSQRSIIKRPSLIALVVVVVVVGGRINLTLLEPKLECKQQEPLGEWRMENGRDVYLCVFRDVGCNKTAQKTCLLLLSHCQNSRPTSLPPFLEPRRVHIFAPAETT